MWTKPDDRREDLMVCGWLAFVVGVLFVMLILMDLVYVSMLCLTICIEDNKRS